MYHDAYAHLYQKSEGFKINIKISLSYIMMKMILHLENNFIFNYK